MIRQRPGTAVDGGGRYPTLNLCRSRRRRISGPISHKFAQTEATRIPRLGGDEGSDLKWLKGAAVSRWLGGRRFGGGKRRPRKEMETIIEA